jgi:hypothetical protein
VKEAAPGLENLVREVKAEMGRLGTQGAMELASALFQGHAFVPFGPGQNPRMAEHSRGVEKTGPQPEAGMGYQQQIGTERGGFYSQSFGGNCDVCH